ncbi:uncharacterized protein LOC117319146 [Pecten maximus]|uniref:uncharacterized protein LOC117319146 n=1 Tax=Pecten maximus TaxID=6579 RepID=UPI0014589D9A|nr:uncharacterized protein LOC117319146 [Pecten maximus]
MGNKDKTVYICLFTCASTRAIHLEIITDLTEKAFILAFRRFISKKSTPKIMISDNGTTFVAASETIRKLTTSELIEEKLGEHGTEWKFIPKRAPWFGGFWERMIGIVKGAIFKVLNKAYISMEELQTLVSEVEMMINDRPLTHVSTDVRDPQPLTPSHLHYGRRISSLLFIQMIDISSTESILHILP